MTDCLECVKEYKNIYNCAMHTKNALEAKDSICKLDIFFTELKKTVDEDSKNNFHNIRKLGNATVMKEHCELREQTSSDEVDFQEKNRAEELFDCLCTECYKFSSEYVPNAKSVRKRLFVRIKKRFLRSRVVDHII